ncbi:hypothetical protein SSX86_002797 [Deinandra increscens subsp. villosa]|uniref:F-box protein n=1 Tax=Deinandra increscens subsp. villosa TaxID=3103831 RepID=A0AAP0DPS6_9ASTR
MYINTDSKPSIQLKQKPFQFRFNSVSICSMAIEENSELQVVDVFDLLPNALVFEIFNRVGDARSLSACAVLCKRFGDLVSQTHNVSLEITRRNTPMPEVSNPSRSRGYIGRFILKPIYAFVNRMVSRKSKTCSSCSDDEEEEEEKVFRLPNDLLKNFKEIRCLSVKLPGHDGNVPAESGSGALLKWKAEFGTDLESCVILGATGFQKSETKVKNDGENEMIEIPSVSVSTNLTSKQLKKRVVWTISCLIASSARHHMLKQIISLNRRIREVKISDGSKQGTIEMTEEQVAEVRKEMNMNMNSTSAAADTAAEMDRTRIPAVTIKMWYVPVLELPESGSVMKGATLAVIRPTGRAGDKDCDVSLAVGAFGEKFTAEAVRKLMDAKKSYTLEMNSF